MSTGAIHTTQRRARRITSYVVTVPALTAITSPISLGQRDFGYLTVADDPLNSILPVLSVEIKRASGGVGDPRVGGADSAAAVIEAGEAITIDTHLLNNVWVANPDPVNAAVLYVTLAFSE